MFDHIGIFVSDTARSFPFFEKSLAPLGIVVRERQPKWGSIVMSSEQWPPFLRIGPASLLKRWLLGTHQGAIAPEHLDYYLDEFTFRFNRRASASRGKLFYRLAQQAVQVAPVPYQTLVGGTTNPKHHP